MATLTAELRADWDRMMARSFEPRQWFDMEDESLAVDEAQEAKIMWVYRPVGDNWAVGFYSPDRQWHAESTWPVAEAAAQRVRWLNGGSV